LFGSHISNKENTATVLQSLRQYIRYHIQSSKTYLHSRIRKKAELSSRQINLAKYETDKIIEYRGRKEKTYANMDNSEQQNDGAEIVLRSK